MKALKLIDCDNITPAMRDAFFDKRNIDIESCLKRMLEVAPDLMPSTVDRDLLAQAAENRAALNAAKREAMTIADALDKLTDKLELIK